MDKDHLVDNTDDAQRNARDPSSTSDLAADSPPPSMRCEETGETSFCDESTGLENVNELQSKVTEPSANPPITSVQKEEKPVLNGTGECTNLEDDDEESERKEDEEEGEEEEDEEEEEDQANQLENESSGDEAPGVRLRRRDESEDDDDDEDDYYTDSRLSETASEEELDSAKAERYDTKTLEKLEEVKVEDEEIHKEKKKQVGPLVDKRDPTYVPRDGTFYLHDARDVSESGGSEEGISTVVRESKHTAASLRRPGMLATRWAHDRYVEQEQAPRTTEEIIRRYGYDIRKYGIDADQVQSRRTSSGGTRKRGKVQEQRRRGVRYTNAQGHPSAAKELNTFDNEEFPKLEETQKKQHTNPARNRQSRNSEPCQISTSCSEAINYPDTSGTGAGGSKSVAENKQNQKARRIHKPPALGVYREEPDKRELLGGGEGRVRRSGNYRGGARQSFDVKGDTNRSFRNSYSAKRTVNRGRRAPNMPLVTMAPTPLPSLQQPQLPLQAPRAGKRYSMNRQVRRLEPVQKGRGLQFGFSTSPDVETRQLCRSVDPSLVGAVVQQHQMENPEAFKTAKAASLSMAEKKMSRAANRPAINRNACQKRDLVRSDGDTPTAKGES